MFRDYATSSSVWLLLAVKLKPFSWNVLEKKRRGEVIVSVEDVVFVFLVMQTVITMTFFLRIYRFLSSINWLLTAYTDLL